VPRRAAPLPTQGEEAADTGSAPGGFDVPRTLSEAVPTTLDVAVVGLGYVGLVTAAGLATRGHRVRGVDADPGRLEMLRGGRLPVVEPGVERILDGAEAARFRLCDSVEEAVRGARVVLVAVGTHDGRGGWQTDTMDAALRAVVPVVDDGAVLAIRSTLPPAYATRLGLRASALRSSGALGVVLNPEFTRESTALADFLQPDRIVVGVADDPRGDALAVMRALYAGFDAPIVEMSATDAALTKLASNLFLATKISFANEVAALCDLHGATVDRVLAAVGLDARIGGAFLRPGVGFGGSCLPHQVRMTVRDAEAAGQPAPLLAAVEHVNRRQRRRVVDLLLSRFPSLAGRRVALLGLAFKPGTDDTREAPALDVAAWLLEEGAEVVGFDPLPATRERTAAALPGLRVAGSAEDALSDADAVVLLTEWPELARGMDWTAAASRMRGDLVIDGRNALDPDAVRAAGLAYVGFGRGGAATPRLQPIRLRVEPAANGTHPEPAVLEPLAEAVPARSAAAR
jgi:UDPglucose 6-dehydrogenase